jgi:hypothetical protein
MSGLRRMRWTQKVLERVPVNDRGFCRYGDPIVDDYERITVTVQESSSAMGNFCWLRLEGSAHLRADPEPYAGIPHGIAQASMMAHLDIERAKELIDSLSSWIEFVEGLSLLDNNRLLRYNE